MAEEATVDHQGVDGPPEGLYRYDRTANKRVPTLEDVTEEDRSQFERPTISVLVKPFDSASRTAAS